MHFFKYKYQFLDKICCEFNFILFCRSFPASRGFFLLYFALQNAALSGNAFLLRLNDCRRKNSAILSAAAPSLTKGCRGEDVFALWYFTNSTSTNWSCSFELFLWLQLAGAWWEMCVMTFCLEMPVLLHVTMRPFLLSVYCCNCECW